MFPLHAYVLADRGCLLNDLYEYVVPGRYEVYDTTSTAVDTAIVVHVYS